MPRLDLRVGARFAGAPAQAVRAALQEAADLIARMPATYMMYPQGGPVLPTARSTAPKGAGEIVLDAAFLAGVGSVIVPRDLWRALGRFAAWARLMRAYAARQDRILKEGTLGGAMTWSEPAREEALSRERALMLLAAGMSLHCVWSGCRLDAATLDIDHCLPWSTWPWGEATVLDGAEQRSIGVIHAGKFPTA